MLTLAPIGLDVLQSLPLTFNGEESLLKILAAGKFCDRPKPKVRVTTFQLNPNEQVVSEGILKSEAYSA
ncbi:hypothetical protein CEXT_426541 [Caerostris extrusa]|uniref:Uncharacterized protein n=1 Tax=Caerostris extrusa TaxID=172846 RepID=A0AAV4Y5A6_CAEEX|nr:hypothetical protein CEXT_426541 [Caerostris extrusa]